MKELLAVARQEILLIRSEYIPSSLYFLMPLVILAFVQGTFEIFLQLTDPGTTASGAALAAPGQATLFGFMSLATFGYFFLGEHGWGTWDRVRSVGVRPWQIMGGKVAVHYVKQLLLFCFVMTAGILLFDLRVAGPWSALLVIELLTAAVIMGYGLIACALASNQAQFNAFSYLGALVLAGLGGALTPFDTLPSWAQFVAPATPTYWAVRGFSAVVIDGDGLAAVLPEILALSVFAVVFFGIGIVLFDPDKRRSSW